MERTVFAIDPGPVESGFVQVAYEGKAVKRVCGQGKHKNQEILDFLLSHYRYPGFNFAIEMIASYGMAVGREVFETCVWIGRFLEAVGIPQAIAARHLVYRLEEKQTLCHSTKAKDSNIIQALVDKYAPGQPNHGKGTKKTPGFFYGFSRDAWQAMAVAVTWLEREGEDIVG